MPEAVWAGFRQAGFTCWSPEPTTVRPAPSGHTSGRFTLPGPTTFVTAENPQGRVLGEMENRSRRTALIAFLDGEGLVWHPAVGGLPEGGHLEPGAAVLGLDLHTAAALGARFDQAAVYLWTPDALHLVACAGDRHEVLGYRATPGTGLSPAGRTMPAAGAPPRPRPGGPPRA